MWNAEWQSDRPEGGPTIPHSAFHIPHWGGVVISLAGKRAFVTGGTRGIGRATAVLLARAGASVAVGYRSRRADADEAVGAVGRSGGQAVGVGGDLGDAGAASQVVEQAVTALGGLDILVVNHGVWPPDDVPLAEMDPRQWGETVRANLDGVFHVCRAAIPRMADGGRMVLVSSTAGQRGEAFHADYAATKGAVISLTKSLAVELAPRIAVNCVAPGWVETEMAASALQREGGSVKGEIEATIPLGRIATADDIAGPIVFLCSDLARHITGEIVNVNGGSVLCG
jgi:3-oxoacyl-[acyl-carrier protein] reductase